VFAASAVRACVSVLCAQVREHVDVDVRARAQTCARMRVCARPGVRMRVHGRGCVCVQVLHACTCTCMFSCMSEHESEISIGGINRYMVGVMLFWVADLGMWSEMQGLWSV
jgi:hypothetical protein